MKLFCALIVFRFQELPPMPMMLLTSLRVVTVLADLDIRKREEQDSDNMLEVGRFRYFEL